MTDLGELQWVVWQINVEDPDQRAGTEPKLGERTQQTMMELAASLGCIYEGCCDNGRSEANVPYYVWWVRLPMAEHVRYAPPDIPPAIKRLYEYLVTQLPPGLEDEVEARPDMQRSYDHAASAAFREAYADLIAPIERAVKPLRSDGAAGLEPRAKIWIRQEQQMVGTFDLCLSRDPDAPDAWLVLRVGMCTDFAEDLAAHLGDLGFSSDAPLLLLPRPSTAPLRFTARVMSGGSLLTPLASWPTASRSAEAVHQWMAPEPQVLADRVVRDLTLLLLPTR